MPISGVQIPARGLTSGEGQVGGKGSGAHGGHEGGRCWGREGLWRWFDGEQGQAAVLRGAVMAFRWPEGRRAVGKWLDSFHVMMWCWWCACPGLRGDGGAGRRRGRAAAEARARRRSGPVDLARETEIGWACEHQWVAAMLLEYWVEGGERHRRLSTVSRSYGGALAGQRAWEEEGQCKCGCVNARESTLGAQGCASSRGEGTASESCCCQAGGGHGSSGRRRRDVEKQGGVQRGVGSRGRGAGAARGAEKGGAGKQELGTWPVRAAGSGREENRAGGLDVDEGRPSCNFPKVQELHCKA
jgi:hypothetical protein